MLRSFLVSLALTATTVLSQCPTHYDYSVTDRMAPQINGAVSAKINGSAQTLFAQQVNVMSAVNATGIALYPRNSGAQTGPYNVTAAIYPDPALGSLNAIAVTNFRVGNQWAQYNQTNEMQPFIVSFPNLVQLNAGSYYVAFIAANLTASPPSDPFGNYLLEWATATNSVISRGFPVNDTFSYSPMNVTVINGSISIDSGILVSIVSQPTSCAPDLSSSSSSTGGNSSTSSSSTGDNSAMSDHHVSSNLLIVVAIVVSACLL